MNISIMPIVERLGNWQEIRRGLFFDYLKQSKDQSMQDWYNFVTEVG